MESDANGVDKEMKTPTPFGLAAMDLNWLFSSNQEKPMVTIKCETSQTFTVLKPILIKHSKFFEKCLRNPCKESESLTVELPEVRPSLVMLYLTLATRQALGNGASTDTLVNINDFAHPGSIESHVRFYQLCDYLQNEELAKGTHKMLVDFIKSQKTSNVERNVLNFFAAYSDTFAILEQGHAIQARIRRVLVKSFCSAVSPPIFFEHCDNLKQNPDFLLEVTKQYALNSMWKIPTYRSAAEQIKTQRILVDDESEPEREPED
ncbi:hypothetical protein KHU50_006436 [Colletotrichum sp. SAR 10_65]|nr:hypothetical protein KHU50_006436 [Colletotrichum sp. SAR 10_65]KAI8223445.1 hypothetical protein K4K53_006909 [Colletotrichum sp. SAR 10_77]